jgi:hypothetical protein
VCVFFCHCQKTCSIVSILDVFKYCWFIFESLIKFAPEIQARLIPKPLPAHHMCGFQ